MTFVFIALALALATAGLIFVWAKTDNQSSPGTQFTRVAAFAIVGTLSLWLAFPAFQYSVVMAGGVPTGGVVESSQVVGSGKVVVRFRYAVDGKTFAAERKEWLPDGITSLASTIITNQYVAGDKVWVNADPTVAGKASLPAAVDKVATGMIGMGLGMLIGALVSIALVLFSKPYEEKPLPDRAK